MHREIVDLDDDAVDLVVERVARVFPAPAEAMTVFDVGGRLDMVVDCEAGRTQIFECFALRFKRRPLRNRIGKERKAALRGQLRIELTHAARRGVARVGKDRQPFAFAPRVELLEVALREINFASHLEEHRQT